MGGYKYLFHPALPIHKAGDTTENKHLVVISATKHEDRWIPKNLD